MRQTFAESKNTVKYPNFGAVMSFRWSDLLVAADFHRAILIRRTLSIRLPSFNQYCFEEKASHE